MCCNTDGGKRLPLFVVGEANDPKCFIGNTGGALGTYYSSALKVWINRNLFFACRGRFEAYVACTVGRKVVILLDNASCHTAGSELPFLYSVEIFLPARTMSILQPLDAGIIADVKQKYMQN